MDVQRANPLIVQSDRSILLETDGPRFEDARDAIAPFAELIKSPEHIHTYRVTPLSLWNAAAAGMSAEEMIVHLKEYSKYEVPENILFEIRDTVARYGRLKLYRREDGMLVLESDDALLVTQLTRQKSLQPFIEGAEDGRRLIVRQLERGNLKCALIKLGFPVEDLAGYVQGAPLQFDLRATTLSGKEFSLRKYQIEAVDAFYAGGSNRGGSGAIVLPCGAGKRSWASAPCTVSRPRPSC